jgi:hypothetical protein
MVLSFLLLKFKSFSPVNSGRRSTYIINHNFGHKDAATTMIFVIRLPIIKKIPSTIFTQLRGKFFLHFNAIFLHAKETTA